MGIKKTKLSIGVVLLIALLISSVSFVYAADENFEGMIFSESFLGGMDGLSSFGFASSGEYSVKSQNGGTLKIHSGETKTGEFGGVKGLCGNDGYDDVIFEFNNEKSKGIVTVNFDFVIAPTSTKGGAAVKLNKGFTSYNSGEGHYLLEVQSGELYYTDEGLGGWADTRAESEDYKKDELLHVEMVFDLDKDTFYVYLNGKKVRQTTCSVNFRALRFNMSGWIKYLGNLDIEYYENYQYNIKNTSVDYSANKIKLKMAADIAENLFIEDGYYVTDLETAKQIPATASITDTREITISPSEHLVEGGIYLLGHPDIYSMFQIPKKSGEFQIIGKDEGYLSSFVIENSKGEELFNNEKNDTDIKIFKFGIGNILKLTNLMGGIEVKDSNGNDVSFKTSIKDDLLILTFDKYLKGNDKYEIKFTGGANKTYSFEISTKEGIVKAVKCDFRVMGDKIDSLNGVTDTQTVSIKMSIIKTLPINKNVVASFALWNGKNLENFDFDDIDLKESDEEYEAVFETKVKNPKDSYIEVTLWDYESNEAPVNESFTINY